MAPPCCTGLVSFLSPFYLMVVHNSWIRIPGVIHTLAHTPATSPKLEVDGDGIELPWTCKWFPGYALPCLALTLPSLVSAPLICPEEKAILSRLVLVTHALRGFLSVNPCSAARTFTSSPPHLPSAAKTQRLALTGRFFLQTPGPRHGLYGYPHTHSIIQLCLVPAHIASY